MSSTVAGPYRFLMTGMDLNDGELSYRLVVDGAVVHPPSYRYEDGVVLRAVVALDADGQVMQVMDTSGPLAENPELLDQFVLDHAVVLQELADSNGYIRRAITDPHWEPALYTARQIKAAWQEGFEAGGAQLPNEEESWRFSTTRKLLEEGG